MLGLLLACFVAGIVEGFSIFSSDSAVATSPTNPHHSPQTKTISTPYSPQTTKESTAHPRPQSTYQSDTNKPRWSAFLKPTTTSTPTTTSAPTWNPGSCASTQFGCCMDGLATAGQANDPCKYYIPDYTKIKKPIWGNVDYKEFCDDRTDNDYDGLTDCNDADCPSCHVEDCAVINLKASLDTMQEVPMGDNPLAKAEFFATLNLSVSGDYDLAWGPFDWSGLSGKVLFVHLHGPAAPGANAPVQISFPDSALKTPSFGEADLTTAQVLEVLDKMWYVNIHTSKFPGGEIRGQIIPQGGQFPVFAYFSWTQCLDPTDTTEFAVSFFRGVYNVETSTLDWVFNYGSFTNTPVVVTAMQIVDSLSSDKLADIYPFPGPGPDHPSLDRGTVSLNQSALDALLRGDLVVEVFAQSGDKIQNGDEPGSGTGLELCGTRDLNITCFLGEQVCFDRMDDDGDDLEDCDDPDCPECEGFCFNDIDDDGDNRVDCLDLYECEQPCNELEFCSVELGFTASLMSQTANRQGSGSVKAVLKEEKAKAGGVDFNYSLCVNVTFLALGSVTSGQAISTKGIFRLVNGNQSVFEPVNISSPHSSCFYVPEDFICKANFSFECPLTFLEIFLASNISAEVLTDNGVLLAGTLKRQNAFSVFSRLSPKSTSEAKGFLTKGLVNVNNTLSFTARWKNILPSELKLMVGALIVPAFTIQLDQNDTFVSVTVPLQPIEVAALLLSPNITTVSLGTPSLLVVSLSGNDIQFNKSLTISGGIFPVCLEDCSNRVDDSGDGKIDCQDATCFCPAPSPIAPPSSSTQSPDQYSYYTYAQSQASGVVYSYFADNYCRQPGQALEVWGFTLLANPVDSKLGQCHVLAHNKFTNLYEYARTVSCDSSFAVTEIYSGVAWGFACEGIPTRIDQDPTQAQCRDLSYFGGRGSFYVQCTLESGFKAQSKMYNSFSPYSSTGSSSSASSGGSGNLGSTTSTSGFGNFGSVSNGNKGADSSNMYTSQTTNPTVSNGGSFNPYFVGSKDNYASNNGALNKNGGSGLGLVPDNGDSGTPPWQWCGKIHFLTVRENWHGYNPLFLFKDAFYINGWEAPAYFGITGQTTLFDALVGLPTKRDWEEKFIRKCVLALLNADNPNISFPKETLQVINEVWEVLHKFDVNQPDAARALAMSYDQLAADATCPLA
eukprot:g12881.t1